MSTLFWSFKELEKNKSFVTFTSLIYYFLTESVNLRFVVKKNLVKSKPIQIRKRVPKHFCQSDFSCDPWLDKDSSILRCPQINSFDRFHERDW